jgi:predicted exporter
MAVTGCLLVASFVGIRRLAFDTDVLSLLPRDGHAIPAFRSFLARFGSLDQLFVVLTAPEGHGIGEYREEVDAWTAALRSAPEIVTVDAGVLDRSRDLSWLGDRQLLLLGGSTLDAALARFEPAGMGAAVADSRELLAAGAGQAGTIVQQDPLGIYALLRKQLGSGEAGLNLSETGYVTPDGRGRLLIAKPARPPYDASFSRALFGRLRQLEQTVTAGTRSRSETSDPSEDEPRPPLKVEFVGGYAIALETEAIVKRESIMNSVGSLALIVPLLFIIFRSAWLAALGAVPSALSLAVTLGAMGFAGLTLSAAATGAAAMLFGLGVDGVVLVYVTYRLGLAGGLTPGAAIAGTSGPSVSMLLGMLTTAATFLGLMFVDFPSLQELGRLIGYSMALCGVFTLVLVPALLPRRAPRAAVRSISLPGLAGWIVKRHRIVLAGAAVVTMVLGGAAVRLRINPSLERLRSTTGAADVERRISAAFGLPGDVYVVLAEGTNLDALLTANERLVARVRTRLGDTAMQAPSTLLPSEGAQAARARALREAGLTPAVVHARLVDTARSAGFRPDAFAPFDARLPRLLDSEQRLTYEGYVVHGFEDLIGRLVHHDPGGAWTLATYVYPQSAADAAALRSIVEQDPSMVLTGLPAVNGELAQRFLPQFLRGLFVGTIAVVLMVALAFRSWKLSTLALLPTAIGLVWTAGLLGLGRVELDLFAVFTVVTFVGIGVDYGIHLVHHYHEHHDAPRAVEELAPVILVAALMTLLGYGTLVTSTYPPLRSIGLVSVISVVALAAASVLVLPALLVWRPR